MCANYRPVTQSDRMMTFFGVERAQDELPIDVWPTGLAPFIRLAEPGSGNTLVAENGLFGLLPGFQAEVTAGRRTYNARSETVATKPSFRESWKKGWRCIVPAESIYEPSYETGEPVRWHIQQFGAVPMGIAGIYREWTSPTGQKVMTFAMLTVNADDHPTFKRFHEPGAEKRMVAILEPSEYGPWLTCSVSEAMALLKQHPGPFECWAAPLPRKAPKGSSVRTTRPPKPDAGEELF